MALRLAIAFAAALAAAPSAAWAQRIALYLEGGGDILVREYEVREDRVRYYSIERGDWEEIPLDLVDLKRTEAVAERDRRRRDELRNESAAERAAEARARTELHNVPIDDGVYHYLHDQAAALQQAEVQTGKDKKRGILKVVLPIPVVAGKNTLYLDEEESKFAVAEDKPIFFVRDSSLDRFGIARLTVEKGRRVAQILNIVPQTKEIFEEQDEIEVFRRDFAPGVYRVWPVQPLEPGEYAVIDYTPGEGDLRVWDFSVRPAPRSE